MAARRLRPGRPHRSGGHDGRGGPGGGDQEIGVGQRGRHIGGPQGPATHRRGHLGRAHLTAAGHGQPPDAGLAEQLSHELARAAGPEHDCVAGSEAAQVRGGEVQARSGQRDAFGADAGLRAGPFAGPQRRVDQASDGRAGGPRRGGRAGRGLDLGDDLVLTDGHRVKTARDREKVLGGRAADPDPGHRQHLVGRDPSAGAQQARHGANHRPGHPSGWPDTAA